VPKVRDKVRGEVGLLSSSEMQFGSPGFLGFKNNTI
jgi:hypothetical protein